MIPWRLQNVAAKMAQEIAGKLRPITDMRANVGRIEDLVKNVLMLGLASF